MKKRIEIDPINREPKKKKHPEERSSFIGGREDFRKVSSRDRKKKKTK